MADWLFAGLRQTLSIELGSTCSVYRSASLALSQEGLTTQRKSRGRERKGRPEQVTSGQVRQGWHTASLLELLK